MIGKIVKCLTQYYDVRLQRNSIISYVRTHRIVSIPRQQIDTSVIIGDLKLDYEDLFLEIVEKVEQFHNEIMEGLLE